VHKESCIAFWGIQCDACYRACPLLDEAITLEKKRNERTGKHAFLLPEVSAYVCTGCGLCEHACITEIPAIKVFPRDMVMGKAGSHYVKGWDPADEQRINDAKKRLENYDESSTIDYLNNSEDLFDD
jgi:ferredoxin-type protein NapG